jgi:hypothetical protein
MIFGFGWRAFWISIAFLVALTLILRLAGCNVLII